MKRPMLATAVKADEWHKIKFPVLASPKIDGVRAICVDGVLLSRSMKAIPNRHTQALFGRPEYNGLDGELVVGNAWDKNLMQQTMSGVMSVEGEPHVEWHVFDDYLAGGPFEVRTELAASRAVVDGHVWPIGHMYLQEVVELQRYEESRVSQGYEGVMLRDPDGPYKQGRSTLREGYLLKIKRFVTDEAKVVGVTELMHNDNELTTDERGYAKRSTHQDNKRPAGVLGSLEVVDKDDRAFSIGTGFTAEQRKNLWEGRQYLVGKTVTFKHFPIGVKDAPRFPTFVAFRDGRDM